MVHPLSQPIMVWTARQEKDTTMVTMDDVISSAIDLTFGDKVINTKTVKFALQIAACSAQQSLSGNGRVARVLARYVDRELPDRDTLVAILRRDARAMINSNHLNAIYHAQTLEQTGQLDGLVNCGHDLASQHAWRSKVYGLFHVGKKGYGMGYKTISFAHMLLWPMTCSLVPVDRHHLARLDEKASKTSKEHTYIALEQRILAEQTVEGMLDYPLSWFAWLKWEQYRQESGVSLAVTGCESHMLLSPYWY